MTTILERSISVTEQIKALPYPAYLVAIGAACIELQKMYSPELPPECVSLMERSRGQIEKARKPEPSWQSLVDDWDSCAERLRDKVRGGAWDAIVVFRALAAELAGSGQAYYSAEMLTTSFELYAEEPSAQAWIVVEDPVIVPGDYYDVVFSRLEGLCERLKDCSRDNLSSLRDAHTIAFASGLRD